jgi:EmrB/QacA subfamily drug resistance transporter
VADPGTVRARLVTRLKEKGTYPKWVLATALVGMFATSFPVTILTVSLNEIAEDFGTSETLITWVLSAPLLASAIALPVLGKMGDLYGQRKVFVLGFGLATLTAGLTGLAWSPLALIGLRTLTQMIGAATQPTSMALIMRAFPPADRVKAMGWWSLVGAGAPAVGLAVGGPMVEWVGWRFVFISQAVVAVVPVVVAWLILEETPRPETKVRFDVPGSAALTVAAAAVMLALSQSADWGWDHPAVLASVVIGPLAAWVFVRIERRVEHPLFPLELLRRRNFLAPLVTQFFSGAAYQGGFVLTPLVMGAVFGWEVAAISYLMLLRPLTYSLASPIGGRLGAAGERRAAMAGIGMLAVAMALYTWGTGWGLVPAVAVALVLQGVGNGVARPSLTSSVANAVSERDLGVASASHRMFNQIGNAFGIAILTAVYAGDQAAGPFARAYGAAFLMALVAYVAAMFIQDHDRSVPDEIALAEAVDEGQTGGRPAKVIAAPLEEAEGGRTL